MDAAGVAPEADDVFVDVQLLAQDAAGVDAKVTQPVASRCTNCDSIAGSVTGVRISEASSGSRRSSSSLWSR